MTKLRNLESIAAEDIDGLEAAGMATTEDVLQQAASRTGRGLLAEKAGLSEETLQHLASIADLMRITGLGEPHAQLLAALDIPTAGALARQEAPVLIKQMRRKNVELLVVRGMPPESTVARWIEDAKALPPGAAF